MYNLQQYKEQVLIPALNAMQLYSDEAIALMLGTMAVESKFGTYLVQQGGPALGAFQMEPATHDNIWNQFLPHQAAITSRMMILCGLSSKPKATLMVSNLMYATCMARIRYLWIKEAIPKDLEGQAAYWLKFYNAGGKGTVAAYLKAYKALTATTKAA